MTAQTEFKALTLLRSMELTADMETEHLKKLAAAASEVEFSKDEVIYDEGQSGKGVYIIQTGQVVIEMKGLDQTYIVIHRLGPGELFGWSSLFPRERKNARARALEPTQAIALDANRLRSSWRHDKALENAIIQRTGKVMLDRIRNARKQLVDALASGVK